MNATHSAARGTPARRPILIGDRIEVMGNLDCLRAAAEMFDWQFLRNDDDHDTDLRMLSRSGVPIIAIENTPAARNLFHFTPPPGPWAVVVGNERKGISRAGRRLPVMISCRIGARPASPGSCCIRSDAPFAP
jgi:hypothetical protein